MTENSSVAEKTGAVENQTPGYEAAQPQAGSPAYTAEGQMPQRNRKKVNVRRRKRIKRIVALSITLVILAGAVFGIYELMRDKTVMYTHTAEAYFGSMSSTVYASGQTKAKRIEDVFVQTKSKISEVMVVMGQQVMEGEPLYTVDYSELQEDILTAEDNLALAREELDAILAGMNDLSIYAPFAGKITEVSVKTDDKIGAGQRVAIITDDKTMKLKQYFSYTYEGMIKKGMSANVSIPSSMAAVTGTVSDIAYVSRITPEGVTLFEVEISIPNPGTLTGGMLASSSITAADGELMTPYESGELEYNRTAEITAKTGGTVISLNMRDYENVENGRLLVALEGEDLTAAIKRAEKAVTDRQKILDDLLAQMEIGSVAAPLSGVVTSCMINPGDSVEAGYRAMTIADLSDMKIEAQVNEMDIGFLQVGMFVMINQDSYEGTRQLGGTIEDISLQAAGDYGVSYFPVTIGVENFDGGLKPGMSVWLEIVASQVENCLLVPNEAIKNMPDGSICVFVKADSPPENYIDESQFGEGIDIVPDGFYAVPVEVGMADAMNAEIRSGLNPGDIVFSGESDQEDPYGMGMYDKPGMVVRVG